MSEYGQVVAQGAGQASGSGGGGGTDLGSAIGASLSGALNQASATLGISPTLLLVIVVAAILFVAWFVFAR
jgi:hypothetical protein